MSNQKKTLEKNVEEISKADEAINWEKMLSKLHDKSSQYSVIVCHDAAVADASLGGGILA